jgi:ABC-2 type transport system ATP-binding protein
VPAVIACDRLTKRYGDARGVDDLSLRVEAGEVFGFLGPNGAGKSTTIRTMLDLHRPTSGAIRLFGLDSRRESRRIRSRVGDLAGEFTLGGHLTGRRALDLFAGLRGVRDLGRAHDLVDRLGAELDRPLAQLSRGNRQKIGLVLALFHAPELLVLDEPTTGLDPLVQAEFHRLVAEHRDAGGTVFLSSHDLEEVQRLCDRVAVLREGRLVAVDDVSALRAHGGHDVAVRLDAPVDLALLRAVPGVEDVDGRGALVRLRVHGDLDPLLRELGGHHVLDLEITRPSLDDVLLDLYRPERPA